MVLADIPGLIEGAHAGAGLGHEFLRHVERCRVLIHLVDIAGLTYEEAAAVLEIPQGTVMSRLHRGRKRVRDALRAGGMTRGTKP